jgi:cytochrome c peroxidase
MAGVVLDLTRLVGPLAGAGCADPPPPATGAFTGNVSGSWWNAARGGEGQFITFETVGSRNVAYLAYFTYTADGAATWLVGNADFAAGARSVTIPLVTGSGARFGSAFRAQDVTVASAGSVTLAFTSCSVLSLTYAGSQSFTLNLTRLVGPLNGLACTDATAPSASDTALRALLNELGIRGNARAGRTLPSIDDPLPQLGKLLFFSKALSAQTDSACATCHHPALGGTDSLAISIGAGAVSADLLGPGRRLPDGTLRMGRNANTFFNSGLFDSGLFWDSRIESLGKIANRNGAGSAIRTPDVAFGSPDASAGPTLPAAQARFPIVGPIEMLGTGFPGITGNAAIRTHVAARLGNYGTGAGQLPPSGWLQRFRTAFGNPAGAAEQLITFDQIMLAISEYERSATFAESAFARYARGDNAALTEQAKQGAILFFRPVSAGGANCVQCHLGETLTNERHHALGFPQVGPGNNDGASTEDFGRGRTTSVADDRLRFRTPSLLNVEVTGPYGHSGAYGTLEQAIEHYFTPTQTTETLLSSRSWCQLPPFNTDPTCAASAATVASNTRTALDKMRADQAFAGLTMPALDPTRFPATAVADIAAFLRSLTDPCVKDRACLSRWIPRPDEAPDGHQLNAVDANGRAL